MSQLPVKRDLGRSGIVVSGMGLGCWAIGGPFWRGDVPVGWGEVDDEESIRAIQRAFDLGVNFFDTADVYGAGHSERILGRALAGIRDEVVIATKFGTLFNEETRQITGSSTDPAYVRQACEASLKRLGTDRIDLYQLHSGGLSIEDAAPVRDVLEDLVAEGKIRAYGWSTDDPERALFFAEGEHCTSVQHQMNVLADAPEIVELCEERNLASINRGPLAMGLLSGKYDEASKLPDNDVRGENAPSWMQYFKDGKPNPVFLEKLEAIREILTADGRSLVQGALGWLWARSEQTIPIPGFRTVSQVEENAKAMDLGPLSDEQAAAIDNLLDR
jgi:aryl-alcohol dehydrogenase-like predicted oxidoreductase